MPSRAIPNWPEQKTRRAPGLTYSMHIFCKWRMDRVRIQSTHLAKSLQQPGNGARGAPSLGTPSMASSCKKRRYGNSRQEQTMKFLGAHLAFGFCLLRRPRSPPTKFRSERTGSPRPNTAGIIRRSSMALTPNMASTSRSCRAARRPNNELLLAAGRLDFYMGGNLLLAFDAVARDVPIVVVAADFKKIHKFSCRTLGLDSTHGRTCGRRR